MLTITKLNDLPMLRELGSPHYHLIEKGCLQYHIEHGHVSLKSSESDEWIIEYYPYRAIILEGQRFTNVKNFQRALEGFCKSLRQLSMF